MSTASAVKQDVLPLTFDSLKTAVSGSAAAFRCRRRLQPGGGEGDKVFPPTFAGAVYAIEARRVAGREQPVTCVLLDSVQSQANRMEQALQEALDAGDIALPLVTVDFSEYSPTDDMKKNEKEGRLLDAIGKLTSLQVPHRLADAILRDSEHNGEPFRNSAAGRSLNQAGPLNATPLYQLCPTALLFGMWDSTGPKGGLGAKFERAIVSEVVGIGAEVGDLLRGVRRDPLEVRANVKVRKLDDKDATGKTFEVLGADVKGGVNPSKINHSSVPFPEKRDKKTDDNHYSGVTIGYAEQVTTLSLICLRRLRFPTDKPEPNQSAANVAGRAVLAAVGLCAATLAFESGMGLRSRCLLWPEHPMHWELLAKPGEPPQAFALDSVGAKKLLADAVSSAEHAGLTWQTEPLTLKPSKELLQLVKLSQQQAKKEAISEGA